MSQISAEVLTEYFPASTDHEDAAVGQERGAVSSAALGKRAGRAEGAGVRVPDLCRVVPTSPGRIPAKPPTTRTRPSGRSVAVCSTRGCASEPVGLNVPASPVAAPGTLPCWSKGWARSRKPPNSATMTPATTNLGRTEHGLGPSL